MSYHGYASDVDFRYRLFSMRAYRGTIAMSLIIFLSPRFIAITMSRRFHELFS